MKNVMYVFVFFAMIALIACNHNNSADITEKGKVADTIKGNPTFINNQIHSNASSVSGAGTVITTPGDVKITNSKWHKNLSDTAAIKEIIYHTAVSTLSHWGPSNTSVGYSSDEDPLTRSFKNYFKMACSNINYISKSNYTSAQWDSMLQAELISGRPTYGGVDGWLDYHSVWHGCMANPTGQIIKHH
jgi:hypothetical protein